MTQINRQRVLLFLATLNRRRPQIKLTTRFRHRFGVIRFDELCERHGAQQRVERRFALLRRNRRKTVKTVLNVRFSGDNVLWPPSRGVRRAERRVCDAAQQCQALPDRLATPTPPCQSTPSNQTTQNTRFRSDTRGRGSTRPTSSCVQQSPMQTHPPNNNDISNQSTCHVAVVCACLPALPNDRLAQSLGSTRPRRAVPTDRRCTPHGRSPVVQR